MSTRPSMQPHPQRWHAKQTRRVVPQVHQRDDARVSKSTRGHGIFLLLQERHVHHSSDQLGIAFHESALIVPARESVGRQMEWSLRVLGWFESTKAKQTVEM